MASIGQVVTGLRTVLTQLDAARGRVAEAEAMVTRTTAGYAAVLTGSGSRAAGDLAAACARAHQRVRTAEELLARCESAVRAVIDRLGGGESPSTPVGPSPGMSRRELIRREARRVGRTGYGAETRGSWLNADGSAEPVTSGRNTPWYQRTRVALATLSRRHTALDTHCEAQAVVRMRDEGVRHATLVLSRAPCGVGDSPPRPYTCDSRLSEVIRRLLPPGSTLTVVDPDDRSWSYPKEDG